MLFDAKLVEKKSWWVRIFPFWMLLAPAVDTGIWWKKTYVCVIMKGVYLCRLCDSWLAAWLAWPGSWWPIPWTGPGRSWRSPSKFYPSSSECWTSLVPVPYFRKQWGGSGSALWETSWCRIRMEDTYPDLKDKNSPQKNAQKNCKKYKIKKLIFKCKIYRTVPAFIKFRYC